MYLIDTDVISELRKKERADPKVRDFFRQASDRDLPLFLSAVTVGELRRGVELIRYRGDARQAGLLERWLDELLANYGDCVLAFDMDVAHVWGRLRVPHPENPLDKQIAATALLYDLTLVTGNTRHFEHTGIRLLDPFER